MKQFFTAAFFGGLLLVAMPALAADPSGVWKSSISLGGQTWESTLRISYDTEGRVLSGVLDDGYGTLPTPLTKATCSGAKLHFVVRHELSGEKVAVSYNGTISGGQITGIATFDFGDRSQPAAWTAKRQR